MRRGRTFFWTIIGSNCSTRSLFTREARPNHAFMCEPRAGAARYGGESKSAASGVACVSIPTDLDVGASAPPEPPLPPAAERVMTEPIGSGSWFSEAPRASAVS